MRFLDEPKIPKKENHFIVRGIVRDKNSKYSEFDFYVLKPFNSDRDWRTVYRQIDELFLQSKKKFKSESEKQFRERHIQKQSWFYFHFEGNKWNEDFPIDPYPSKSDVLK